MKINRKSQFTSICLYVTAFSSFESNSQNLNAKKPAEMYF